MTTCKKLIKWLQENYEEDKPLCVAIWSAEDILERAKELEIEITEEQANIIIETMDRRQSADLGVSWDTIDCYLDEYDNES